MVQQASIYYFNPMAEIIQLSRRNFLIGTAAALAASALPSLPKAEQLNAILVESQSDYVERHIQRIWVSPMETPDCRPHLCKLSFFLSGSDKPYSIDCFNILNGWCWVPFAVECPVLFRDQFIRLVLEPVGEVAAAKSFTVGMIVDEKDEEGFWHLRQETHEFPSRNRHINDMIPNPYPCRASIGVVEMHEGPPENPELINDPCDGWDYFEMDDFETEYED
jgi:hypothetical protein